MDPKNDGFHYRACTYNIWGLAQNACYLQVELFGSIDWIIKEISNVDTLIWGDAQYFGYPSNGILVG